MDLKSIRDGLRAPPKHAPAAPSALLPRKRRWARVFGLSIAAVIAVPLLAIVGFYAAALVRETHTAAELAPPTGRFVATEQGRIFVQEKGPAGAPLVILIHGTAAWSELWRETIDHLASENFRVIAIDLPPFGFSDRPAAGNYTRKDQAARIAALIDALGAGPVFLVGHSFGAGPTVETAMRYPEKVRGLVLADGALGISDANGPQPPPALVTSVLDTPFIRTPLVAAAVTNPLMTKRLVQMMVYRREAVTDARVAVLQRPGALRDSTRDLGAWLKYFVSIDRDAWSMDRRRYGAIKINTALIWGEQDALTPLAQGRHILSLIGGASLVVLPGVGHIPQIEDPSSFAPALAKALRGLN